MYTLKELHRLETAIQQSVAQLVATTKDRLQLRVSAYDENIAETTRKRQREVEGMITDALDLITARYALRAAIQTTNTDAGIDGLLNKLATLQAQLKAIPDTSAKKEEDMYAAYRRRQAGGEGDAVPQEPLSDATLQRLAMKFKSVRANAGWAVALQDEAVIPLVLSQESVDGIKANELSIRREIDAIKDQVGGLNVTTKVDYTLSAFTEKLLKRYRIIA